MSKTVVSGWESWPQGTPSQSHTSMTSGTVASDLTEKSTKIVREDQLRYSLIVGAIAGALVAFVVCRFSLTYSDGMKRSGYFPVSYKQGNETVTAMVPMYMTDEERRKTIWGKK